MQTDWFKVRKESYVKSVEEAVGWHLKSRELMRAADILLQQMMKDETEERADSLAPTYMLLSGFALENCVKGIAAIHGQLLDLSRMRMALPAGGHSELDLYLYDHVFLSDSEKDVLRRLSGYVKRDGRYHVDTYFDEKNLGTMRKVYFAPTDPEIIREMYQILTQYLLRMF